MLSWSDVVSVDVPFEALLLLLSTKPVLSTTLNNKSLHKKADCSNQVMFISLSAIQSTAVQQLYISLKTAKKSSHHSVIVDKVTS